MPPSSSSSASPLRFTTPPPSPRRAAHPPITPPLSATPAVLLSAPSPTTTTTTAMAVDHHQQQMNHNNNMSMSNSMSSDDDDDDDDLDIIVMNNSDSNQEDAVKQSVGFKSLLEKWKVQDGTGDSLHNANHIASVASRGSGHHTTSRGGKRQLSRMSAKAVIRQRSMAISNQAVAGQGAAVVPPPPPPPPPTIAEGTPIQSNKKSAATSATAASLAGLQIVAGEPTTTTTTTATIQVLTKADEPSTPTVSAHKSVPPRPRAAAATPPSPSAAARRAPLPPPPESPRQQQRIRPVLRRTTTKELRRISLNANVYQKPIDLVKDFQPPKFTKTKEEKKLIRRALKRNFVFSDLTDRDLKPLVAAFEKCLFRKGHVIIRQGDPGDFFYILQSGKIAFSVNGITVGKCKHVGSSFGEMALLYTCPRAASVTAARDTQLFRVDQTTFRFILQSQSSISADEKKALLLQVPFLSGLTDTDLKKLSEVMMPVTFDTDDVLVKKGDTGESFFLVQEGQVLVKDISVGTNVFTDLTLGPGEYFGERSLVTNEPRAATVVGVSSGIAFSIDRKTFEKVLGDMSRLILRAQDRRALGGIQVIADANLDIEQQTALAQLLDDQSFETGRKVLIQDKLTYATLYLLREGKVRLTDKNGRVEVIEQGGYFGQEMLIPENVQELLVKSPYTVEALEDSVCGVLTLTESQSVFEVGGENNRDGLDQDDTSGQEQQDAPCEIAVPKTTVTLQELERHKILGEGNFGQVWLVSETLGDKTRRPYALKIQTKFDLIQEGQAHHIMEEKKTMMKMHHPFIIKLFATYQDDNLLYMLEELVQGGELFSLMHPGTGKDGLPEDQARFYAVCIADALAYMHRGKYVFRDLKPENVLIDRHGYPVVIDFGFAKYVPGKTYTLCGTPGYLPPEVVMTRGHNCSADHWSLGILIYEMLAGESPFFCEGMDQMTLFSSIVQDDYEDPPGASPAATEMIAKFLAKEPTQRLGSLARGEREIFEQDWFKDIDLQALRRRELVAPWVPRIKDALDTRFFDDWDHLEDKTKKKTMKLEAKDAAVFVDF